MIKSDDTGKLVLRLTLGILILLHGLFKITGGGVGGALAGSTGGGAWSMRTSV